MRLASIMGALALGLWLGLGFGAASARELTEEERGALDSKVDIYVEALGVGDFDTLIDNMPAPLVAVIAARNGLSVEDVSAMMREAAVHYASAVHFEELTLSGDDFTSFEETSAGLVYGFAPTRFVVSYNDDRYGLESRVMALYDGAEWHLLRIEAQSTYDMLIEAYPSLEGMPYEPEIVTPIEPE